MFEVEIGVAAVMRNNVFNYILVIILEMRQNSDQKIFTQSNMLLKQYPILGQKYVVPCQMTAKGQPP